MELNIKLLFGVGTCNVSPAVSSGAVRPPGSLAKQRCQLFYPTATTPAWQTREAQQRKSTQEVLKLQWVLYPAKITKELLNCFFWVFFQCFKACWKCCIFILAAVLFLLFLLLCGLALMPQWQGLHSSMATAIPCQDILIYHDFKRKYQDFEKKYQDFQSASANWSANKTSMMNVCLGVK